MPITHHQLFRDDESRLKNSSQGFMDMLMANLLIREILARRLRTLPADWGARLLSLKGGLEVLELVSSRECKLFYVFMRRESLVHIVLIGLADRCDRTTVDAMLLRSATP